MAEASEPVEIRQFDVGFGHRGQHAAGRRGGDAGSGLRGHLCRRPVLQLPPFLSPRRGRLWAAVVGDRIFTGAADGKIRGVVVTFDDLTELEKAQRMAAWGDVARRIAHEIKNPLTPIQLSAERIKRKFGRALPEEDAEKLEQMTGVIIRQTGDLRRIVDEFSKFARMPEPERKPEDLAEMYLERLRRYDPVLQCVITLTEERALRQARRADRDLARGIYHGPLHGIPWVAKDLLAVAVEYVINRLN